MQARPAPTTRDRRVAPDIACRCAARGGAFSGAFATLHSHARKRIDEQRLLVAKIISDRLRTEASGARRIAREWRRPARARAPEQRARPRRAGRGGMR